jgi:hypothetical protein
VSPYEILGIKESATPEEIKKAWVTRCKMFHPDRFDQKSQPEEWRTANEMLQRVNEAYNELRQRNRNRRPEEEQEEEQKEPQRGNGVDPPNPPQKERRKHWEKTNKVQIRRALLVLGIIIFATLIVSPRGAVELTPFSLMVGLGLYLTSRGNKWALVSIPILCLMIFGAYFGSAITGANRGIYTLSVILGSSIVLAGWLKRSNRIRLILGTITAMASLVMADITATKYKEGQVRLAQEALNTIDLETYAEALIRGQLDRETLLEIGQGLSEYVSKSDKISRAYTIQGYTGNIYYRLIDTSEHPSNNTQPPLMIPQIVDNLSPAAKKVIKSEKKLIPEVETVGEILIPLSSKNIPEMGILVLELGKKGQTIQKMDKTPALSTGEAKPEAEAKDTSRRTVSQEARQTGISKGDSRPGPDPASVKGIFGEEEYLNPPKELQDKVDQMMNLFSLDKKLAIHLVKTDAGTRETITPILEAMGRLSKEQYGRTYGMLFGYETYKRGYDHKIWVKGAVEIGEYGTLQIADPKRIKHMLANKEILNELVLDSNRLPENSLEIAPWKLAKSVGGWKRPDKSHPLYDQMWEDLIKKDRGDVEKGYPSRIYSQGEFMEYGMITFGPGVAQKDQERKNPNEEIEEVFPLKIRKGRIEVRRPKDEEYPKSLIWNDEKGGLQKIYELDYPLQSPIIESPQGERIAFIIGTPSSGTWPIIMDLVPKGPVAYAPFGKEGNKVYTVLEDARSKGATHWSEDGPTHVYANILEWTKGGELLIGMSGDGGLQRFGVRITQKQDKWNYIKSKDLPEETEPLRGVMKYDPK